MFNQVMDWNVKKHNTQAITINLTAIQLDIELYLVDVTEVKSKQCYKAKFAYEK